MESHDGRVKVGIAAAIEQFLLGVNFLALREIGHAGEVRLMLFDFVGGIDVLHVLGVAGGDEEVFVAVEVDVEEDGGPGPFGSLDAGEVRDFGVGAVAAIEEEGIAHDLRAVVDRADGRGHGRLGEALAFAQR